LIVTSLPHRTMLSPNVDKRGFFTKPDMLILHYTGMTDAEEACVWLCNPESKVSCHYLIDEDGAITHMVDEAMKAWHAGASSWQGESKMNSKSIGIEIHNPGHYRGYPAFPAKQMAAVIALGADIITRHRINARRVLAHSDVAPGRKIDPGEKFDWPALHRAGIGHWVAPEPISGGTFLQEGDTGDAVMAMQTMLKLYGYGVTPTGTFDQPTRIVVEAFQRHFRPALVDGIADQSTVATLHRLLTA
jgi:N-acetylmuramoyl-L-alanine amidase